MIKYSFIIRKNNEGKSRQEERNDGESILTSFCDAHLFVLDRSLLLGND